MALLISIFTNGLVAAGLALLIRSLIDWSEKKEWLQRKPLGCNACMAFWTALPVSVLLQWGNVTMERAATFLGAYIVAYATLESFWRPPPPALQEAPEVMPPSRNSQKIPPPPPLPGTFRPR